jgi:hypothetical protein
MEPKDVHKYANVGRYATWILQHVFLLAVVKFINDRMYYIIRSRWFHVIVLNVHAPAEDKIDYVRDGFYKKLERINSLNNIRKFC